MTNTTDKAMREALTANQMMEIASRHARVTQLSAGAVLMIVMETAEACRQAALASSVAAPEQAEPVSGFVRLSKSSEHGKPYRAWEHAKAQARLEIAPALASLIVRDVCETEPSDPENDTTVCINVGDLEAILLDRLAVAPLSEPTAEGVPPKPFAAQGRWFPVSVLDHPMREFAPGKWEYASWPSEAALASSAAAPEQVAKAGSDRAERGTPCELKDCDPDSPTYRQWFPARFVATDLVGGEPIVQKDRCMPVFATWASVRFITRPSAPLSEPADASSLKFALQAAWPYVHQWCTIDSVRNEVSTALFGRRVASEDHGKPQAQRLETARDALEAIALAGMSGSGQESEEGMRDWHARRAWEFISIAARALSAMAATDAREGKA